MKCVRPIAIILMIICLVQILSISTVFAQTHPKFEEVWGKVKEFYGRSLRDNGIVGSSLVFVRGDRILAEEYFGMADIEQQRAVDAHTIYHWASITKTFTGIAIMQLRDRGLLTLDDPIIEYIPELKEVHNPYGDMAGITIRNIMTHSAGFRGSTWPWGGDKPWHPHEPLHWEQVAAMLPYTEILFEPGSRFSYSNPGIIFLGRIIELLTTDDYEVYVDKNILKPLGMANSYFDYTPYHLLKYRSNNYTAMDGETVPNGLDFNTGITVSNGGLNAPLTDMAKYLAFLMGDPKKQSQYDGILKRSSLEEMWEPRLPTNSTNPSLEGFTERIGLIFFCFDGDHTRLIGHTGSQKAFISFFYIDPEARTGCIVAFNTVGTPSESGDLKPDTRALSNALRARLFKDVFPLFHEER